MPLEPGDRRRDYNLEPSPKVPHRPTFVEPHSPWQTTVETRRAERGLSIRELASSAKIPHGTLFNWLRNATGYPPRHRYTKDVNLRIAGALRVPPQQLAADYDESILRFAQMNPPRLAEDQAPYYPAPRAPGWKEPSPGTEANRLVAALKASGNDTFTIKQIEDMAKALFG